MFGMRSRNPILNNKRLDAGAFSGTAVMSLEGFINKTGILFALLVFSFAWIWNNPQSMSFVIGAAIVAFILAIVTSFNPAGAKITAPIYALCEGVFLGGISRIYEIQAKGLVLQAVVLTFGVFAVMLFLYRSRIIQATEKMRMVIFSATGGIALLYFVSIVLGFFGVSIPLIFGSGPIGILFSLFVVGIASFMLIIDFDMIENMIGKAPKQLEWYSAFALMVTIVWLYLEILRLLSKLNRR